MFTATPLDEAGTATFKAKDITFDDLLTKLFEIQTLDVNPTTGGNTQLQNNSNQGTGSKRFTFKKEDGIYYFGSEDQLSVRNVAIIHLQHRSVELLSDPSGGSMSNRSAGRNANSNVGFNTFNSLPNNVDNTFNRNNNRQPINTNNNAQNFNNFDNKVEALINILPDEVKQDLDITVDYELNSFYVNGPSHQY